MSIDTIREELRKMKTDPAFRQISNLPIPMSGLAGVSSLDTFKYAGRDVYVIHGSHTSLEAMKIVYSTISPAVRNNPGKWIFMVEGVDDCRNPLFDGKISLSEITYLMKLADLTRSPCEEPIIDMQHRATLDLGERKGYEKNLLLDAAMLHQTVMKQKPNLKQAKSMNTPLQNLEESFARNRSRLLMDTGSSVVGMQDVLAELANELSTYNVDRILSAYPSRTSIVACVGRHHLPVFDHWRSRERFIHTPGKKKVVEEHNPEVEEAIRNLMAYRDSLKYSE